MKRYEAIPRKYWYNKITKQMVSIYGAVPYTSESEKGNWEIVQKGFSVRDNVKGTVHGNNYPPYYFETAEEAENRFNKFLNK